VENSAFTVSSEEELFEEAVVDTGATHHITANTENVQNIVVPGKDSSPVKSAFGTSSKPIGIGKIGNLPGECLVMPESNHTLISVSKLDDSGGVTIISGGTLLTFKPTAEDSKLINEILSRSHNEDQAVVHAKLKKGLYRANLSNLKGIDNPDVNVALYPRIQCHSKAELVRAMHESLKHCPKSAMVKIAEHKMLKGWPDELTPTFIEKNYSPCSCCAEALMKQKPLPNNSIRSALKKSGPSADDSPLKPGDLVVGDVFGPFPNPTFGKHKYFIAFKDLYSSKVFGYLLKDRKKLDGSLEKLYSEFVRAGHKIKKLRLDQEFKTSSIEALTAGKQTSLQWSAPDEHEQNGAAERIIQTIQRRVTANMLNSSKIPIECWGYCVLDVITTLGLQPTQATNLKTPDEIFCGSKPDISKQMILPFGLPVKARLAPIEPDNKFSSRSFDGLVVGTAAGAKHSILILNPLTKRQYVRRSFVPFNPVTIYNGYPDRSNKIIEDEWDVEQDPDQEVESEPPVEIRRVTFADPLEEIIFIEEKPDSVIEEPVVEVLPNFKVRKKKEKIHNTESISISNKKGPSPKPKSRLPIPDPEVPTRSGRTPKTPKKYSLNAESGPDGSTELDIDPRNGKNSISLPNDSPHKAQASVDQIWDVATMR
jgi:hypothetical protein